LSQSLTFFLSSHQSQTSKKKGKTGLDSIFITKKKLLEEEEEEEEEL
tara:strand:- start:5056 stop:5196 length:141 start_codon:yes stop_codon:yes gene_type:complete